MADKKNDFKAISDRVNKVAASQAAKAVSSARAVKEERQRLQTEAEEELGVAGSTRGGDVKNNLSMLSAARRTSSVRWCSKTSHRLTARRSCRDSSPRK